MLDQCSVVEHAYDTQSLAKELEHFSCVLPDKFVVGSMIVKLSSLVKEVSYLSPT
jgi:hypothetical protein